MCCVEKLFKRVGASLMKSWENSEAPQDACQQYSCTFGSVLKMKTAVWRSLTSRNAPWWTEAIENRAKPGSPATACYQPAYGRKLQVNMSRKWPSQLVSPARDWRLCESGLCVHVWFAFNPDWTTGMCGFSLLCQSFFRLLTDWLTAFFFFIFLCALCSSVLGFTLAE